MTLIQTANGYVLCAKHAEAWQRGGNDVSMWEASEWEAKEGGNVCADCADEPATTLRPFPADGVCTACDAGADLRYSEKVEEYRSVDVDDGVVVLTYIGEHGDGDGEDATVFCRNCLTEYEMPADFDWA